MSKSKKKNKGITIRGTYFIFWITTIISFIFTINTNSGGKMSNPLVIIFLVNILAGIGLFIFLLLSKFTFEKPERNKFSLNAPILAAIYFSLYVTLMTLGGNGLIASEFRARVQEPKIENNAINFNVSSPTPTVTPTSSTAIPKQIHIAPTNDPDPIISCKSSHPNCLGQSINVKTSICNNIGCCIIDGKGYLYETEARCRQAQNDYYFKKSALYNSKTANPYPTTAMIDCYVSYPCLNKTEYYKVDQSTCNFMKSGAASTCSTANAIKKMQDIVNEPLPAVPTAAPIDGTIHIQDTPTTTVPVGFRNF